MSDREAIERHMERMRKASAERARQMDKERAQQEAERERIAGLKSIASKYAVWASRNGIPTEQAMLPTPHKPTFGDFFRQSKPTTDWVLKPDGVWRIAAKERSTSDDKAPRYTSTLVVDSEENIYGADPSRVSEGVLLLKYVDLEDRGCGFYDFSAEDVHITIAEKCLELGIQWDVPE